MFKQLSLKKLSKNMYVRLAMLSSVTGAGGLGIYQAIPSSEGPDQQTEVAEQPSDPNALAMLDDPAVDANDQFRMPPPDEAIVRGNNDDEPPADPTAAGGVYSPGTPQPAAIPAYQPPVDPAAAYTPVANNNEEPTAIATYQPPPVPADVAATSANNGSRYQPVEAAPAEQELPVTDISMQTPPVQSDTSPLRAPPAGISSGGPYSPVGTPQPASPAPIEVGPIPAAPVYGGSHDPAGTAATAEVSPAATEPAALPQYNPPQPTPAQPGNIPVYNTADSGTPTRPIAVPEGSERYGELPPQGMDQLAGQGIGIPGDPKLEGPQSPNLQIEKVAPDEIQVGKQARFEIRVTNAGKATAHQVVVLDDLPRGVRLVSAAPPAERTQDGALMWQLGALRSGEESTISLDVMPLEEGEIGSVATVSFQAQASVSTRCTRPQLALEHAAPKQVLIGQKVKMAITLSNPGTGAATGVVIKENVPEGLRHEAGSELEYEVGTLRPGESRQLELTLIADKPGTINHVIKAVGDGSLDVEHRTTLEVTAPQMQLSMSGPKKRYLDRQATYTVAASNPGTAPATDVEVVARLPRGMKFLAADNEGQYDSASHAVYWSLQQLPAATAAQMQVVTLPVETGEQKLRVDGRAALGVENTVEHLVGVEGLAEIFFTVTDTADPIEVGKETEYTIKVVNQGSKAAEGVVATALLPQGMEPVSGDGPTRATQEGAQIIFAPLASLAPKEEATYKIRAQGMRAGDHRITVQVVSNDTQAPVAKEESTRVYSDQ